MSGQQEWIILRNEWWDEHEHYLHEKVQWLNVSSNFRKYKELKSNK